MSQTSLAAGASFRLAPNAIVKGSLATGVNGGATKTAVGVGVGWSF